MLGHETGPLAPAGNGGVWATAPWHQTGATRLRRIDARMRLVQSVETKGHVVDFQSSGGSLWIATTGDNRLLRIPE